MSVRVVLVNHLSKLDERFKLRKLISDTTLERTKSVIFIGPHFLTLLFCQDAVIQIKTEVFNLPTVMKVGPTTEPTETTHTLMSYCI